MSTTTTLVCGWKIGTEAPGAAPDVCGKPAKSRSTEAVTAGYTETAEVCGVHARSATTHGLFVEPLPGPDVRVGQVWADNDPRSHGRKVCVVEIVAYVDGAPLKKPYAVVEEATARWPGSARPPRRTRITLARFVSNSTGYRLVQDVEG